MDERLQRALLALAQIASGNYANELEVSDEHDEYDALATGINMLAEELADRELERKSLVDQLAHRDRMHRLGQSVATVVHELRSPLSAMKLQAHAFASGEPDEADLREDFIESIERLETLVSSLLRFSTRSPQYADVRLEEVIRKLRPLMGIRLRHMGIEFRLELPESLPVLSGHEIEIGQVLVNLIDNAANVLEEAGTPNPCVILRAREEEDALVVEVEDNGPGFEEDHAEQAFEDFMTGRDGGVGLGLGICRRIVQEHGGELTIASLRGPTRIEIRLSTGKRSG